MTGDKNIVSMNSGAQLDDLISCLDHCGDFNHKPDICRYGKAEFPARVLPREMQITDFLFWYYRGESCSAENLT